MLKNKAISSYTLIASCNSYTTGKPFHFENHPSEIEGFCLAFVTHLRRCTAAKELSYYGFVGIIVPFVIKLIDQLVSISF